MKPKMTYEEKKVFDWLKIYPNKWFTSYEISYELRMKAAWISERKIRKAIASLRLVHNKKIASSHKGYCYTTRKKPLKQTASFIRRHALLELKTANAIDKQANHEELAKQLELELMQDEPPKEAFEMASQLWRLNIEWKYVVKILAKSYNITNAKAQALLNQVWDEDDM